MFEATVVVSLVIALGQLLKPMIQSKYVPLVTLVIGVAGGFIYIPHASIKEAIFNGVIVALSANGLFDVTKMLHKPADPGPVQG